MNNKNKKILVLMNLQNDFVTGVMANNSTRYILPNIVDKIVKNGNDYSTIFIVRDIHFENYEDTLESEIFSSHCLKNTNGKNIVDEVWKEINTLRKNKKFVRIIDKHSFGSKELIDYLSVICTSNDIIEFCGFYTDVDMIINILATRVVLPNTTIKVDANCCEGTDTDGHIAAIKTMKNCNVDVVNFKFTYN